MKRPVRQADGCYYIDGKKYKELFGSREQVMNETAYKTAGELKKEDFVVNKDLKSKLNSAFSVEFSFFSFSFDK